MITLADGLSTIQLHPDLRWVDAAAWNPVEQATARTVTGALIISSATRIGGRPLTLQPEDESSAWMPKVTIDALRAWAATPGKTMTLTIYGAAYTVIFRHQDDPAFEARPIIHYSDIDPGDWYSATLKFMEI